MCALGYVALKVLLILQVLQGKPLKKVRFFNHVPYGFLDEDF
jgi:hypothetical protein